MQKPLRTVLKRRAAVVFVSNCNRTNTQRLERIQFLVRSGIEVHSFGSCLNTHSVKTEFPECARLRNENPLDDSVKVCVFKHYRFAITVENFYEENYLSEKVFHALLAGAVPIYYGHPGNKRMFPSARSVLMLSDDVESWSDVEEIFRLMTDDKEYDLALEWKFSRKYISDSFVKMHDTSLSNLPCIVCDTL